MYIEGNVSVDDVVYWTWSRFNKGEKIFFISDPPHWIKTLRNNLKNSHGHQNTRQLIASVFLPISLFFSIALQVCFIALYSSYGPQNV